MSLPSHFPTPSSLLATGPPSSPSLNTQARSHKLTLLILGNGSLGTPSPSPASTFADNDAAKAPQVPVTTSPTPPESRNASLDGHAAEASQVPTPEITSSPVNDPELPVTDAETITHPPFDSMKPRTDAINDHQATTAHVEDESLNAALITSSAASGQGKGKGKDPELYDIDPIEDGNSTNRPVDWSTEDSKAKYNAAEALVRLRNAEPELEAASILLNMNAKPYNCKTCPEGTRMGCANCLRVPWRHSAHSSPRRSRSVSPSPESEDEDEGPKRIFIISHNGIYLQYSVREGNAVFALANLLSQRNRERLHRRYVEGYGALGCDEFEREDTVPLDDDDDAGYDSRYVEGYKALGCKGFEREDTVPLDDGDDDAGHDSKKYGSQMLSRIPKLNPETLERLKAMKGECKSDPDTLTETSSDTSASVTMCAKESSTYGSVNLNATIDPEATASASAPLSSQRASYPDRRNGKSYSMALDPVDLTETISSLSPASTRQARQMKAIPPLPLKQIQTALKSDHTSPSPKKHNPPTAPVPKPPSATHIRPRRPTPEYIHYRANLPNNLALLDLPPSSPQGKQTCNAPTTKAGPSTPKKQKPDPIITTTTTTTTTTTKPAPPLPTPPSSGRKRKADTQHAKEPKKGQSPASPKKQKGEPVPPSRQPRTRAVMREGPTWDVDEEGEFVIRVPVEREFVEGARGIMRPRTYMGWWDAHRSGHWV